MRKVYYIYNPETQSYDRIYPTLSHRLQAWLSRIFIGMGIGAGFFIILLGIFGSPSEIEMKKENSRLNAQYQVLRKRVEDMQGVLTDIQERDDNLYRAIFQSDPIPSAVRLSNFSSTNRYEELLTMADAEVVVNTTQRLDQLTKQLYIQSRSFDDLVDLCKNRDQMLKCVPAIQPISNKDLRRTASGYGTRIDPIYGTLKFHAGMDFSAPTGTDIYVTGDGIIKKVGWQTGYGNTIVVDHGYGYQTLYAHLHSFRVKVGQKIVRGQVIGGVGNTGKSTAPHLHYEVLLKGKHVNPVNYYFMDISADDYDRMIQIAANHGKVLD